MKKKLLYALWAFLYILCAGLSFIPNPVGFGKFSLIAAAVAFFVPAAILLYDAYRAQDRQALRLIRTLSIVSLSATTLLLAANFLSARASVEDALVLNAILAVVSSPMLCGQVWLLSLFLWACLMVTSLSCLKKLSTPQKR